MFQFSACSVAWNNLFSLLCKIIALYIHRDVCQSHAFADVLFVVVSSMLRRLVQIQWHTHVSGWKSLHLFDQMRYMAHEPSMVAPYDRLNSTNLSKRNPVVIASRRLGRVAMSFRVFDPQGIVGILLARRAVGRAEYGREEQREFYTRVGALLLPLEFGLEKYDQRGFLQPLGKRQWAASLCLKLCKINDEPSDPQTKASMKVLSYVSNKWKSLATAATAVALSTTDRLCVRWPLPFTRSSRPWGGQWKERISW